VNILAIETSCDETAAAVISDGRRVRSNVVWSQLAAHQRYGGVVPELAARVHLTAIGPVVRDALSGAEAGWDGIDAIAVTNRPGLSGALLVGVNAAKGVALARNLPLVGVHHIEGHIAANWLIDELQDHGEIAMPAVCLIVSGGHTDLIRMTAPGQYELLGTTLDDAAGEAFDKGARLLGLGYPGGPAIQHAAEIGDPGTIPFPRAWLNDSFDFSFSGLKTALLRLVEPYRVEPVPRGDAGCRSGRGIPGSDRRCPGEEDDRCRSSVPSPYGDPGRRCCGQLPVALGNGTSRCGTGSAAAPGQPAIDLLHR
jgi:N6-L-threonylcarbamoyladenine synthase